MGKSSKKRKKERERARQEEAAIQQAVADVNDSRIPGAVAIDVSIPEVSTDIENYRIIFRYYNNSTCELSKINDVAKIRKAIKQLEKISNLNSKTIGSSGIIRSRVYNAGDYKSLYKGLPKDVELYESATTGSGRIFFFLIDDAMLDYNGTKIPQSYCCIVSITNKHLRT